MFFVKTVIFDQNYQHIGPQVKRIGNKSHILFPKKKNNNSFVTRWEWIIINFPQLFIKKQK